MSIFMSMSIYIYYIYISVYVYVHVYVSVSVSVYVYVYVYVCKNDAQKVVHVHAHTHTPVSQLSLLGLGQDSHVQMSWCSCFDREWAPSLLKLSRYRKTRGSSLLPLILKQCAWDHHHVFHLGSEPRLHFIMPDWTSARPPGIEPRCCVFRPTIVRRPPRSASETPV